MLMTKEQIFKELELIFIKILDFKVSNINTETKLSDIKGWDSLSHINIIEEIESKFNVNFSVGEIVTLNTISDLIKLIQSKL
jgi:acyl carrier protein